MRRTKKTLKLLYLIILNFKYSFNCNSEVFYIEKDLYEAHDALICIKEKNFVDDKNRFKLSDHHFLKK